MRNPVNMPPNNGTYWLLGDLVKNPKITIMRIHAFVCFKKNLIFLS